LSLIENGVQASSLGLKDAYHEKSKRELLKRFFWNKEASLAFESLLRRFSNRETVVHFHGFRRVLSGSVVKIAKKLGFRTVFTVHDFGIACPNTSFYQFPEQSICELRPFSMKCFCSQCTHSGWKMKAMQMGRGAMLAQKQVISDFDALVYVSEFCQMIMRPYLPSENIHLVIQNPASESKEPPANPCEADVFTFVGRLSPEKGVVLLAEAAKLANVSVRFVGKGPEEDRIRTVNPRAEFTGWLSTQAVNAMIRESRAVVLPSLWYETAGLSVLEAISRGVPAIVTDTCAATEYVKDSVNGFHFKNGSVEHLCEVLKLMNPDTASKLGARGYEHYWKDPLTTERYMESLIPLYDQVLRLP
jgi:glycosyltransferase involved in cell wall biosynthesis